MNNNELFIETVSRLKEYKIAISGPYVYSMYGTPNEEVEFCYEGYNLGYNLYRLGKVLAEKADFS